MSSAAVLAHSAPGFQAVGFSPGLVRYLTLALLVLVTLALRSSWTTPRLAPTEGDDDGAWPGDAMAGPIRLGRGVVAVAGLAFVLVCGWAGSEQIGANPAPIAVFWVFWLGGQVLSAVVGDWWRLLDPYDTIAGVVDGARGRTRAGPAGQPDATSDGADWWVPAALLLTFAWMWLAWSGGIRPRNAAAWLSLYSAVMVVGAVVAGRAWVRRNEAFGQAFGLVALMSPLDWRRARPRLANPLHRLAGRRTGRREGAVLAVMLGTVLFDALGSSRWWADLIGQRSPAGYTVWNTVGLAWMVLLAGAAWLVAARLASRVGAPDRPELIPVAALGTTAGLAVMAGAFAVAHEIGPLLTNTQNLVALLSDPLARGWDLLGTGDIVVNPTLLGAGGQVWTSLILVEVALLVTLVVLHDRWVACFGASGGARATWVACGFTVVAALAALTLLLGA